MEQKPKIWGLNLTFDEGVSFPEALRLIEGYDGLRVNDLIHQGWAYHHLDEQQALQRAEQEYGLSHILKVNLAEGDAQKASSFVRTLRADTSLEGKLVEVWYQFRNLRDYNL